MKSERDRNDDLERTKRHRTRWRLVARL